jgi:predicted kinase
MEKESNKQTAVKWLLDEIKIARILCDDSTMEMDIFHTLDVLIKKGEQALQMGKEQIIDAFNNGEQWVYESSEQYYAETYGKKTFIDLVSNEESQVHEVVRKLKEKRIK